MQSFLALWPGIVFDFIRYYIMLSWYNCPHAHPDKNRMKTWKKLGEFCAQLVFYKKN